MRKTIAVLSAFALAAPVAVPIQSAAAQTRTQKAKTYKGKTYVHHRKKCRYSPGRTGLIAGGVIGALAGPAIIGGGLLGNVVGGVGGALGGRALDRTITADRRCRR